MAFPAALSIVTLGVGDLAVSIGFYESLGWQRRASSVEGSIAWFGLGGAYLGLYPAAELAVDSGYPPQADVAGADAMPTFRGVTLAVNVRSDAEVDAALAVAVSAGARVTVAAVRTEYGVYHACFADPDGHVWEVANAGFPFEDGHVVIP